VVVAAVVGVEELTVDGRVVVAADLASSPTAVAPRGAAEVEPSMLWRNSACRLPQLH